ncbi:chaoptin-like [Vespula squamosa]|uniref:Chaoptin-like n=1 Tax=Vespula squamosa TaxID=30214 RepID=A0ABD2A5W0_VESSQ
MFKFIIHVAVINMGIIHDIFASTISFWPEKFLKRYQSQLCRTDGQNCVVNISHKFLKSFDHTLLTKLNLYWATSKDTLVDYRSLIYQSRTVTLQYHQKVFYLISRIWILVEIILNIYRSIANLHFLITKSGKVKNAVENTC